ncbi:MAG TPA: GNAT family protein [Mycobacteriales bacterium]|jgi:RimJ/RimL family protein N-acetyltransferase|nr:GNAT family protein [Mycobacteriales bacterium]
MLRGELIALRARQEADLKVLHSELQDDVATRSRSDNRPWRPVSPDIGTSPYDVAEPRDDVAAFSVVTLADGELVGDALLWGIDNHNRLAHLGLGMFESARGRGYGADVVQVLCRYGFRVRGLHRLQVETLADNAAMIAAAAKAGFVLEGTLRRGAWVDGAFVDEVILGLLVDDWRS